jgi:hypothetical protein
LFPDKYLAIMRSDGRPIWTCQGIFNPGGYLMVPEVGQVAPDFTLESHEKREIRLSDYRGKTNVVLAFFPLAWTPV